MLKATADKVLPTTITGSLPRPSWYTENLGTRSFLDAMVSSRFREQYTDAVQVYLHEQTVAGLDIVTDGDARFDQDIGGQSWTGYPTRHMEGFERFNPELAEVGAGGIGFPRGHILHDYIEARVMPEIVGPIGRGKLQYAEMFKAAQRLTDKPVKFGTVTPELVAFAVQDEHYKSLPDRIMAISNAMNEELHDLADAGCQVIQMEEPQVHLLAARGVVDDVINPQFMLEVFNNTVKGLRDKTEVWCHTCWGNPSQQRMFAEVQSYKPALELLNQVDADVITFEMKSSDMQDIEAVGQQITDMKVAIGVIDHHTLQVESPDEVAGLIRQALEHIPAERLVLSSDCGMGREGMSRRHALYKMVSLVQGANIVKRELGVPEAECLAADPNYSLVRVKK
jgi:5-methyltetrahydropteroyltriglutamate--homocysteine methyltransferase